MFWRASCCVNYAEGGPGADSGSKSSGWVELRRCFSKQLQKWLTVMTVTDGMLKHSDLYAVTTDGRCHCFDVVVGLV